MGDNPEEEVKDMDVEEGKEVEEAAEAEDEGEEPPKEDAEEDQPEEQAEVEENPYAEEQPEDNDVEDVDEAGEAEEKDEAAEDKGGDDEDKPDEEMDDKKEEDNKLLKILADKDEGKEKEPEELEEDAADDVRARLAPGTVAINAADTTLNVMSSCEDKILMTLSQGGFQHLVGCARGNTGLKAGRYIFEVKIVEMKTPSTAGGKYEPTPRHLLSLGFSTAESSLFLENSTEGIYFDSEGNFGHGQTKERFGRKFQTYQVLGVVLNLEPESPNANTISLFVDGYRAGQPKALPENLKGRALFPTINYKSMTLHVNFGPELFAPLDFKCRMLQDASKEDTQESSRKAPAAGTQREVIFPVGLPDEGTFAWLDDFLKDKLQYTELSERAILQWAEKCNIYRKSGYSWKNSNDRPGWDFGVREMDDNSIKQLIGTIAPTLNRDYVKMEVLGNLTANERAKALESFEGPGFKKIAMVVMGEPPADFKAKVQADILEEKRAQAEAEARKAFEKSQRDKGRQESSKKEGEDADGEEKEASDEKPEKSLEESSKKEGEDADGEEKEASDEKPEEVIAKAREAVELTDAEKAISFAKPGKDGGDLDPRELSSSFSSFTIPSKEEGFDEIRYVWQKEEACEAYLKQWILEQKLTQRVEDVSPGTWFREQYNEWHDCLNDWRQRQNAWKDACRRGGTRYNGEHKKEEKKDEKKEKTKPGPICVDDKMDEDKDENAAEDDKENKAKGSEDGGEEAEEKDEKDENKEKEEKEGDEEENGKEDEPMEIVTEDLDVWTVENVGDVGNGEPLFANFAHEDWALMSLRFEFHLLLHAFRHDMEDPDRQAFHESHLLFYHNRYFRKECNPKWYGLSSSTALVEMLKDTIELNPKSILEPMLSEDTPLDNFVKLTEDERRERQRRIDAGDENAALNIQRPPPRSSQPHHDKGRGGKGGYNDRGGATWNRDAGSRGGYNDRAGSGHSGGSQTRGHSDRGGYPARAPAAPAGYSRGAPPARGAPPSHGPPPSRYSSTAARVGNDGRHGGHHGPPPSHRDHGRDGGRHGGPPAAPPARGGYHAAPPASYGGGQKRSYPPPSSMPPAKHSRSDTRGAPPSRGSYSGHSGGHRR